MRIADILRYNPVDYHVGPGSPALSFQRAYFPMLEVSVSLGMHQID